MSLIKNFSRLDARLSSPDWIEKPSGSLLHSWRDDLRADAAAHAPVWKGTLKGAIQSQQDTAKFPLWARVFSDAPEARWSEFGTGLLSDDPASSHQRYFPSPLGLTPWSDSKGLNPFAVAEGIYQRGGIAPRHFFRDAEQRADAKLNAYLARMAADVVRDAAAGGA